MTLPLARREVAIIGTGPAGATLAYELLQGGLKPLILDKAVFPRIKVCAGGLTIKAFKFLSQTWARSWKMRFAGCS